MKKSQFTLMVARLILWVDSMEWIPLIDYALRSREEQKRLYDVGRSMCDGLNKISAHQYPDAGGRFAVDIYITMGDADIARKHVYVEAHEFWESIGGDPMIDWDLAHFEASQKEVVPSWD